MRFLLYIIGVFVWVGLCWWWYTCHIKTACCVNEDVTEMPVEDIPRLETEPAIFFWSQANPEETKGTSKFLDSIRSEIGPGKILEITGLYFRDEDNPTSFADIGIARAHHMASMIDPDFDTTFLLIKSQIIDVIDDVRNKPFSALQFKVEPFVPVAEFDEVTQIYFPFNSTDLQDDQDIASLMNKVAKKVNLTGEVVELTGHTDDVGSGESNYYLGLWRAGAMKAVLIRAGVSPEQILVFSKGELEPIQSNLTAEGKEKNRRVELRFIQNQKNSQ